MPPAAPSRRKPALSLISEENSRRDVLLRPGQSFRLRRRALAIVEAWTDAAISLVLEAT